jgi:hypothetical protein
LRGEYFSLREEYLLIHGRKYDDYRVAIKKAIKSNPKTFFSYVDFKKKRVSYSLVMHFLGRLASGSDGICNCVADFIQRTHADDVLVPSDPGPDLVQDDLPINALQFIVEVQRCGSLWHGGNLPT